MLNIKPVHGETYSCSEDVTYALCSWWNREYILKFSETWSFSYIPSTTYSGSLFGDRLDANRGNAYRYVEKYHGIKTFEHNFADLEETVAVIRDNLNRGYPVSLNINLFNCPWSPAYQLYHCEHYCIVTDLNESEKILYCTDPFLNKYAEPLMFNDFNMGCKMYMTYELLPLKFDEIDWKDILMNACLRVEKDPKLNVSIFDMMKNFSRDITHELDLAQEIKGYADLLFVPLLIQMLRIGWARINFASVLKYISNKCELVHLTEVAEEFNQCAHEWNIVRGLLIRESIILSGKQEVLKNIECKINALADKEKKLHNKLYALCSH